MKRNILLLGSNGQVGWELHRAFVPFGQITIVPRNALAPGNESLLDSIFQELKPAIVLNAAAYTAVDTAESEIEMARFLNSEIPARLAHLTKSTDGLLVDYSTDYVFNGQKAEPYIENDETMPINQYGLTKLEGLKAIQSSGCRHLVFRVSWVYSSRRKNFLKTMLHLASTRDGLNIIDDQLGVPTSARWIAQMTAQTVGLLDRDIGSEGLYNLTPAGQTTWFGFANEIFRQAREIGFELKLGEDAAIPIPTSQYPTPAARPKNSRLCNDKVSAQFGIEIPAWETFVPLVLNELFEQRN